MRFLLALFLPFVVFFTINRPIQGIFCLILQLTLIGWLPATIWAFFSLSAYNTDKKVDAVRAEMKTASAEKTANDQ